MTELKTDKTFIVIPAKNEGDRIGKVLDALVEKNYNNVIVVDDGSTDGTAEIAKAYKNVTLINHVINLGPGASTMTGIKYAVRQGASIIITIDADNQHNCNDIEPLIKKQLESKADVVIGSRFMKSNDIPFMRIVYNKIGNIVSYLFTGIYLSDSQSGMKAISGNFADFLEISQNGFEFCIEIIKNAKEFNAKIVEIPIDVRYTPDTMRKGQNLGNGFTMLMRLFSPFSY